MYQVELKEGAERKLSRKIYTIYSKWVKADTAIPQGSFVRVLFRGELVGYGFYEKIGPIGLRVLAYVSEGPPSTLEEIVRWRVRRALRLRMLSGESPERGYRLIYADSDGMPGLVIDVYNKTAVVQSSSLGWDKHAGLLGSVLVEEGVCERVYLKNDQRGRKEFGLPVERRFIVGGGEEREVITEGRARFIVDFSAGQKTGFYLDQRPARLKIASMKLEGFRVLDLFSYTGAFSVHALQAGAEYAFLVDESPSALKLAHENMKLNELESFDTLVGRVEHITDALRAKRRRFDMVIADPPAFIPSRKLYERGIRAYQRLIESVLALVKPGGLIYISSCSHHLSESTFFKMLEEQSEKQGLSLRLIFHSSTVNSTPHTRLIDESLRYLKGLLLSVE